MNLLTPVASRRFANDSGSFTHNNGSEGDAGSLLPAWNLAKCQRIRQLQRTTVGDCPPVRSRLLRCRDRLRSA